MTVSIATSESAPETAGADVLVIGVVPTPAGPAAAPGLAGVDEALGGTLADALSALGATGELEEISKIPGGGKLPAALVLAAAGLWIYGRGRAAKRATQKTQSVLVADFANHTGDPVFDGTLEPAFTVALSR